MNQPPRLSCLFRLQIYKEWHVSFQKVPEYIFSNPQTDEPNPELLISVNGQLKKYLRTKFRI
jgi:hypothetical protein